MSIGEVCNREVVIARPDENVSQAARRMREHHVGTLLVVEERDGKRVPVGVVTDRDLVVEVLAPELDPSTITLGDIMAPSLAAVKEGVGVFEAIRYMRDKAIRRLPVVSEDGALAGIVTLDDLLSLLAEELDSLVRVVAREQKKEAGSRL